MTSLLQCYQQIFWIQKRVYLARRLLCSLYKTKELQKMQESQETYKMQELQKIHGLKEYNGNKEALKENNFRFIEEGIAVKTSDSVLVITHLQFPGRRIISASDAVNSHSKFFEN